MKAKLFLIASIVFFMLTTSSALAVDFDSSISPSTIDGGTSHVLVNFSVTNNDGTHNITKLNITMPSGFSYNSGARDDIGSFNVLESNILSWGNSTYLVLSSSTRWFWFYTDTGQTLGNVNFNVSTFDSDNQLSSENTTTEVADMSAPTVTTNTTSPSTPTSYAPNKNYTFNITWSDNIALEQIKFEWDSTAPNYTNATTTSIESLGFGTYGITLTDLDAGNYTYKWYATDWNGSATATNVTAYNVTKADNVVDIYLNGNLNQDSTVNDGTELNITVTAKGNIYIYRNESSIAGPGIEPFTTSETPAIGTYIYKATATGNSNYTSNSSGVSHNLRVIYPPPRYSISTTIPSSWSHNSWAYFYITWTDENDPNGFSSALIQLNHTGTNTNYTMSRTNNTNISTYSLNLTKPMVLSWRVYANNSYNEWNATPLTNTTIAKITPTISLTASPSWDVVTGTQTTVSCSSNQVSINLYRDGVLVSSPDIQTLGTGDYVYVCNNTPSVNYSSVSTSKILDVLRYSADVSFIEAATLILVEQGSSNSTTVIVENIGNASHVVSFAIENITSTWYTLNATEVSLSPGGKASFLVNFSIDVSTDISDYNGKYNASTIDRAVTSDFILRVLPKEELQSSISNDLAIYRVNMTSIWTEINNSKTEGLNVTVAEQKIIEAKEKIELAENYIDSGDYFNAYQLLDSIKTLIDAAGTELESALTPIGESVREKAPLPKWMVWALAGAGILIGGALIYLLWPQPGYDQKTGRYTHKTPKQHGATLLSETKEKIASKIPKPKPKSVYKTSFKESSFKEQAAKISGIEVEQPISKRGRFTLQKTKTIQQKISENISKIKDRLKKKRKYEEVELKY